MPTFSLKIRIRYGECDAQNVVFNARYADFADLVSTEFLRSAFGGYQAIQARGYENQTVKLLLEWKAPARFDDVLELRASIGRVGNSSFSLQTQFIQSTSGELLASSEAVYVFVDATSFKPCAIPDDLKAILCSNDDLGVVDQSGIQS